LDDGTVLILFIAGGVAMTALAFYMAWREKRALAAWAKQRGYAFSEWDTFNVAGRCRGFPAFNRGRDRRVYNIVYGKYKGYDFCFFRYRYTTGSGKNRSTTRLQGLLVEGDLCFPCRISMRPEGFLDKLAEVIGFDDVDFEYHEFNKKYFVKAEDKRVAYDFFGRDVMEYLLMLPRPIHLEVLGPHFLFHYHWRMPLKFFDRTLDTAVGLFSKFDRLTKEKYELTEEAEHWSETFYKASDPLLGGVVPQKGKGLFGG